MNRTTSLLATLAATALFTHAAPAETAGNLACWKPARLLSVDGARTLPANGGGGQPHLANRSVDGDPNTTAQAGGEYAWTLQTDLLKVENIGRITVSFGKMAYATQVRISVSADGKTWPTVAEKQGLDGSRVSCSFPPTPARYVRVTALKPDGPNQPGGQMGVAELEVYAGGARFIESLRAGRKITLVTLGTSLTGGAWRWPDVMKKEWLDNDFPGLVTLHNLGVGASASQHPPGQSGLDMAKKAAALKPDAVFIEFATNDAYLPYRISQADAKKNLHAMMDTILAANPRAEIIVQTMNAVKDQPGSGPHATNRPQLAEYCQGCREVAQERGVLLVDHYPNWLKIMNEDPARFDQLVPDRIHPQSEGYRQVVLPELKKILKGE